MMPPNDWFISLESMMGWLFVGVGFEWTYLTDGLIPAFTANLAGSDLSHLYGSKSDEHLQRFGHGFSHIPGQPA